MYSLWNTGIFIFPRSTSDNKEASRGLEGVILLDEAIIHLPFACLDSNTGKIEQLMYPKVGYIPHVIFTVAA
jgi:hypothetical protein